MDFATLEAFADGVVSSYMRKDKLPGVTLAIVKDGEIVLLKGYGIAGVDPERKVDPQKSLFRIASISKTFIWTAMMQLKAAPWYWVSSTSRPMWIIFCYIDASIFASWFELHSLPI